MPIPLFHFELKLGRGYYVRCFAWETRRDMRDGSGIAPEPGQLDYAILIPTDRPRRCIADLHLCRPALDDGTLFHEGYHIGRRYEERIRARHRTDLDAEEEAAHAVERAIVAARSHIREELRLANR